MYLIKKAVSFGNALCFPKYQMYTKVNDIKTFMRTLVQEADTVAGFSGTTVTVTIGFFNIILYLENARLNTLSILKILLAYLAI